MFPHDLAFAKRNHRWKQMDQVPTDLWMSSKASHYRCSSIAYTMEGTSRAGKPFQHVAAQNLSHTETYILGYFRSGLSEYDRENSESGMRWSGSHQQGELAPSKTCSWLVRPLKSRKNSKKTLSLPGLPGSDEWSFQKIYMVLKPDQILQWWINIQTLIIMAGLIQSCQRKNSAIWGMHKKNCAV